ncbi:hypothetical protein VOLCADRAFT_96607 [Volvox carteri f. nagariensis]|uniref:Uncharacterized protein n=1 Tax=Volvox carteri f. nagariensis TaxID=3068 RepID=D8UAJ9_VOLCA|nr:uncharacterized protein VOLCADRAFT_96607 [Volvox carteri f. nagariensis]EFJ43273.1 hypothetical protein VOLCADRAFT_96607 [Volvox carteri f. nagariensis]|eukprot:XP_002955633.1 hypothetical protein VOLCADRAFT_96607 [Volvox carteri f. nagariensis]
MKTAGQVGAAGSSFNIPAQPAAAQKSEYQSSGAHGAVSNADFSVSHASSCGGLGPLSKARSGPRWGDASGHGAQGRVGLVATATTTGDGHALMGRVAISSRDTSVGPGFSVGAKRTRALAMDGDAASTQTEPSVPCHPRVSSLPAQVNEDSVSDGHCRVPAAMHPSGFEQPERALPLPIRQRVAANTATRTDQEAVAQLLGFVSEVAKLGSFQENGRGCHPGATASNATASAGVSSVLSGLSAGGDSHLSALLSASSPVILDKRLAAALADPTVAAATAQALANRVLVPLCSLESADGAAAKRTGSFGSQGNERPPRGVEHQLAEPDPFPCWQENGVDALTVVCGNGAASQKRPPGVTTPTVEGDSNGSASGSAGDASLTATAGDRNPIGGSGQSDEAAGGGGGGDGASNGQSDCLCREKLSDFELRDAAMGSNAPAACGAADGTVSPVPCGPRDTCAHLAADVQASSVAQQGSGGTGAGPAAARASTAIPRRDTQLSLPCAPVSAQLGAALPPEVAARLKKRIRIIQPISQTWVEETLQCGSGAISQSFSGSEDRPVGSGSGGRVAHVHGSANPVANERRHQGESGRPPASAAAAAALPSSGVTLGAPELPQGGPLPRLGADGMAVQPCVSGAAGEPRDARNAPAERDTSVRDKPAAAAAAVPAAAAPAVTAVTASVGPPFSSLQQQHAVTAATDHPLQLSGLAALAALAAAADKVSPFTTDSASTLQLVPQQQQGMSATMGSTAPLMLPHSYGSNNTSVSATPTTATTESPFSSAVLPPRLASGPGSHLGGSCSDAAVAAGPLPATATGGATALAPGQDSLSALLGRTLSSGLPGTAVAVAANPGLVRAASDALREAATANTTLLPQQTRSLAPLPSQRTVSAANSTSASCLGKVQGELTLLYHWYVANKAAYLDQAQLQLQRIDALTAARDSAAGGSGANAAAAACARAESAEAARAFETALKIMSVCGRVEQQWLSAPPPARGGPPATGAALRAMAAAAPPPPAAEATAVGLPRQASGSAGAALPVNLPAPAAGWSHGACAALAVAAALVGSVGRGQAGSGLGSGGSPPGTGSMAMKEGGPRNSPSWFAGLGPLGATCGHPFSLAAAQRLPAEAATGGVVAGAPVPMVTAAAAAQLPQSPPQQLRASASPLSPPVAPCSQAAFA